MKLHIGDSRHCAFTLVELLIVVAVIVILVAVMLPSTRGKSPAARIACMSNQRQVAIGLMLFTSDHQDSFPWQTSVTKGGTLGTSVNGDVMLCYAALTNYIRTSSAFLCPTDKKRSAATPGATLSRTNVSYFMNLDATLTNSPVQTILTGDRHLESDRKPVAPGLFALSTNQTITWTSDLHPTSKPPGGGLSYVDGHTEWASQKALPDIIARQSLPTNRLAVP